MVERALVGVAQRVGDLANELEPGLVGQRGAVSRQVGVQAQIGGAVVEENGRATLVVAELPGLGDAAMADALEDLVLAPGCSFDRVSGLRGCLEAHQVDPDAALLADGLLADGETVLPRGAAVEGAPGEVPAVTKAQVGSGSPDADPLHEVGQRTCQVESLAPGSLGVPLRGQAEQVLPDPEQAAGAVVPAVDVGLLDGVERGSQARSRQKYRRGDERDAHACVGGLRGPGQPGPQLLGFEVGQVQGIVDRADPVGAVEVPGAPVVN